MHAGRILVLLSMVAGSGLIVAAQSPAARDASARGPRIRELESERRALYEEAKALAGSDRGDAVTFKGWIDNVRARKSRLEARFRGLEDTIVKLGGSIEEIDTMRKRMADEWVFSAGDAVSEGVEKAAEAAVAKRLAESEATDKAAQEAATRTAQAAATRRARAAATQAAEAAAARRLASAALRRVLGVASLAIDVVEYGGRKIFKEVSLSHLEDLVRQQKMTMRDVITLQIAILAERDLAKLKLDQLEALRTRFDDIFLRIAEERQRQQQASGPATDHAVTERGTDAAGDEEERWRLVDGCARINCDCAGVDAGLLTGPFRKECRQAETNLKRVCGERGKVSGKCHPTASGPKAWPQ